MRAILIALAALAVCLPAARADWQYQWAAYRQPNGSIVYVGTPVWVPPAPPVIPPSVAPARPVTPVNVTPAATPMPASAPAFAPDPSCQTGA